MSQFPGGDSLALPPKTSGMAIAGLVLAIVGFCVPGLALVGIILAVIALVRINAEPTRLQGRGLAIGGIIAGAIGLVVSTVLVCGGLMLPALGKARQSAQSLKSSLQLRQIGVALNQYAMDNKDTLPEPGADWQARLSVYGLSPDDFQAPHAGDPGITDSYIYIPGYRLPTLRSPAQTIIAYENPRYVRHERVNLLMADGSVQSVPTGELEGRLAASPQPGAATPAQP